VRMRVPRLHHRQDEQIHSHERNFHERRINEPTRELAQRRTGSVEVLLLWHPISNKVELRIHDTSSEDFGFRVPPGEAMEAFRHPYAYAARRPHSAPLSRTSTTPLEPLVRSNYWKGTDNA
jgi:hypothetical protein